MSEAAKILPKVEKYLGRDKMILDIACGDQKVVPHAIGVDGRPLPGVDVVCDLEAQDMWRAIKEQKGSFLNLADVIFSSHFLEHCPDQYGTIQSWMFMVNRGGLLILYLPDGRHYNNHENPEHMINVNYDDFMFWFRRAWCGEGKDFRGNHIPKQFEIVEEGMDVGEDRYSFYLVARKV